MRSAKKKVVQKKVAKKASKSTPSRKTSAKPKIILTDQAPQPIGPYSQAIQIGQFLFCSGQVALDPVTGQMVGPDVAAQARRVMENIRGVLEKAGYRFENVIKTTIFLRNMGDFSIVNDIYGSYFSQYAPARSTVEVARLPKDALVEIEVLAAK